MLFATLELLLVLLGSSLACILVLVLELVWSKFSGLMALSRLLGNLDITVGTDKLAGMVLAAIYNIFNLVLKKVNKNREENQNFFIF
jgi:hypothetical protein